MIIFKDNGFYGIRYVNGTELHHSTQTCTNLAYAVKDTKFDRSVSDNEMLAMLLGIV